LMCVHRSHAIGVYDSTMKKLVCWLKMVSDGKISI
jgi:hypothetical protein